MTYKVVGFDYGGVLFGEPGTVYTAAVLNLLEVDHQAWTEAYHRHYRRRNTGEFSWEELYKRILNDLGKSEKLEELLRLDAEHFGSADVNKPVLDIVDRLRAEGYKTGLLSNNGAELQDKIRQNGMADHFDVVNISELTGLVKPDPEAFAHFADELGAGLDELVYIDDSRNSLSTAAECGYTPILFESLDQLKTSLTRLGLLG